MQLVVATLGWAAGSAKSRLMDIIAVSVRNAYRSPDIFNASEISYLYCSFYRHSFLVISKTVCCFSIRKAAANSSIDYI
jgi:hypothetical protein